MLEKISKKRMVFFMIFTFFLLLSQSFLGLLYAQDIFTMKLDFGSETSPVATGYTQVTNTTIYDSATGYGFDRECDFRDRGTPDDLRGDFCFGIPWKSDYYFTVDLANGDYHVKVYAGDSIASNKTSITIEGINIGTISSRNNVIEVESSITISDGQMNFTFGNEGRVNGVEITQVSKPTGLNVINKELYPDASLTIGWDESPNADSYNVYRITGSETEPVKIGNTTVPEFTDENVELGYTYTYMISQIILGDIESPKSEEVVVTIADESYPKPSAPEEIIIKRATETEIEFIWTEVSEALMYYVFRALSPNGNYERMAVTNYPQFTDNSVFTTIHYYYKVKAVNLGGMSNDSEVLEAPITKIIMRKMEKLNRGLLAIQVDNGVYVGWRRLGFEPECFAYNLYRNGRKINDTPITSSTNYLDTQGTLDSTYFIRTVIDFKALKLRKKQIHEKLLGDFMKPFNEKFMKHHHYHGLEFFQSETVTVWNESFQDIPLQIPAGGITPSGEYTYHANDISVADLDGDGEYEFIVKWYPSNAKDNSKSGYTGNTILDAYKRDGTLMWRINLGINIRSGAHYTQFMVYDLDNDGKAEMVCKTADGTIDSIGTIIGDPNADYRNENGYILEGPEFLTVFDGLTGKVLSTIDYYPPRGNVGDWGDTYGNRVDRFLACIAYLDGERPSVVMCRGYYTRTVLAAYNWENGVLKNLWIFDSNDEGNEGYAGQGNHSLNVGDVDQDGKDEIIYGACAIDDDGTGLYTTGLGHGDANHLGDFNPDRPGMEYFQVHENKSSPYGLEFRDPHSGDILWGLYTGKDTGRGTAGDIDPQYRGAEYWAVDSAWNSPTGWLFNTKGELISNNIPAANFVIWWDGDLLREILDHEWIEPYGVGVINKWDYENDTSINLLTAYGTYSNNYTKGNPCLQADILGDWREEAIWRTEDSSALRIYTTTEMTDYRIYSLMHDSVYRLGIASQNVGYNQPPHTSFYLGKGMSIPQLPNIYIDELITADIDISLSHHHHRSHQRLYYHHDYITAYIEFPSIKDLLWINIFTIRANVNGKRVYSKIFPLSIGDHDKDGIPDLMVKFNKEEFKETLNGLEGHIELSISGSLLDGRGFLGTDFIKVPSKR